MSHEKAPGRKQDQRSDPEAYPDYGSRKIPLHAVSYLHQHEEALYDWYGAEIRSEYCATPRALHARFAYDIGHEERTTAYGWNWPHDEPNPLELTFEFTYGRVLCSWLSLQWNPHEGTAELSWGVWPEFRGKRLRSYMEKWVIGFVTNENLYPHRPSHLAAKILPTNTEFLARRLASMQSGRSQWRTAGKVYIPAPGYVLLTYELPKATVSCSSDSL